MLKQSCINQREGALPKHVVNGLKLVDYPYELLIQAEINKLKLANRKLIKFYAQLLVWLSKKSFFAAYLISKVRIPVFEDGIEAIEFFRALPLTIKQKDLCLPRSLFVSATSKKFKVSGYMFIGVFLPINQMHAWVIEDNIQVDIKDDIWTLYKPVAVICRK